MSRKKAIIILICFIIFIVLFAIALGELEFSKRKVVKQALDYFCEKYDLDKKERRKIIIISDYLKDNTKKFYINTESYLKIEYQGSEIQISYPLDNQVFADDYQCKQIYNDLLKYLNDNLTFVSDISIDYELLRLDVLNTPQKYDGINISNYMKNILVRKNLSEGQIKSGVYELNTNAIIWIKADSQEEAIRLNNQYNISIIDFLDTLNINYDLNISNKNDDIYKNSFYFYRVTPHFIYFKNITDENFTDVLKSKIKDYIQSNYTINPYY